MKFKDHEPIKFEIFQSDMESIMYQLDKAIYLHPDIAQLENVRRELQHKINIHKERGEWK